MASYFRILCALADPRALCTTDEEVTNICQTLLSGSETPVPSLANLKYLLFTLQGIYNCLSTDRGCSTSVKHSREPSLLKRSLDKNSKCQFSSVHTLVDNSALTKSMLEHSLKNDTSMEEASQNPAPAPVSGVAKRGMLKKNEKLIEKNKHAMDRYMERMNRAHIMRMGPTRLEKLNECVPLSHRRAREMQAAQALEEYMDPLHGKDTVKDEFARYTTSYTEYLYK